MQAVIDPTRAKRSSVGAMGVEALRSSVVGLSRQPRRSMSVQEGRTHKGGEPRRSYSAPARCSDSVHPEPEPETSERSPLCSPGRAVRIAPDIKAGPAFDPANHRIAIWAFGSRGDVQPYVALCVALQEAGYDVMLILYADCVSVAEHWGVKKTHAIPFELGAMLRNEAVAKNLWAGKLLKLKKALEELHNWEAEFDELHSVREAVVAFCPTLLISTATVSTVACCLTEKLGIPHILTYLQPAHPSRQYFPVMLEWLLSTTRLGFLARLRCLNGIGHSLITLGGARWSVDHPQAWWVEKALDLKPAATRKQLVEMWYRPPCPVLLFVSSHLFPRPSDWDDMIQQPGPLTVKEDAVEPAEDLRAFVEAKAEPPIYIGWGSMVCRSATFMTELACRAIWLANARGVVLGGWAKLSVDALDRSKADFANLKAYVDANVFFVPPAAACPHEWLFRRCKLTVHHGGAGTMVAAVRAGRPTIITPVAFDQHVHARWVSRIGCGRGTSALGRVTPKELLGAIKKCNSTEMVETAKRIGELVRSENGVESSVKMIGSYLESQVETGRWKEMFEQRWTSLRRQK